MSECPCIYVTVMRMAYTIISSVNEQTVMLARNTFPPAFEAFQVWHSMVEARLRVCRARLSSCGQSACLRTNLVRTRRDTWASTVRHRRPRKSAVPCLLQRASPGNKPPSTPFLHAADSAGHRTCPAAVNALISTCKLCTGAFDTIRR